MTVSPQRVNSAAGVEGIPLIHGICCWVSGRARPDRHASTTGIPMSAAARNAVSVAPAASTLMSASNCLPMCLLNACIDRTLVLGTTCRFCFAVRSMTYSHAPPPPSAPGETTIQSSGTSDRFTMVNFLPSAIAAFTRLMRLAELLARLDWMEVPTIMSTISCSVSVRIFGWCADVDCVTVTATTHAAVTITNDIRLITIRLRKLGSESSDRLILKQRHAVPLDGGDNRVA